MKQQIADIVKTKRKELKMSQKKLSYGICTQTVISKIENAEVSPSIDIFFQIMKKLNIPLDAIGELYSIREIPAVNLFSSEIKDILYRKNYRLLQLTLSLINIETLSYSDFQYYQWLQAILKREIDKNPSQSVLSLTKLLSELKPESDTLYLYVLNSLMGTCTQIGDFKQAHKYANLAAKHIHIIKDPEMEIKCIYGLARTYSYLDDLELSQYYTALGIEKALAVHSFAFLGELYWLQAFLLNAQGLYPTAKEYCEKAIFIYDLERNETLKNAVFNLLVTIKENVRNEKS